MNLIYLIISFNGSGMGLGLSRWSFYYKSHNIPMTLILTFTFHKEGTETQHHGVTFSESHSQKVADQIQTNGHLPGTPFFEDRSEKRQYKEVEFFENTRRFRLRSDRDPTSVLIFLPQMAPNVLLLGNPRLITTTYVNR